jgi:hypothetical protein
MQIGPRSGPRGWNVFDCLKPMLTEFNSPLTYLTPHTAQGADLHKLFLSLYSPETNEIGSWKSHILQYGWNDEFLTTDNKGKKKTILDSVQDKRKCRYEVYTIFRNKWIRETGALMFCTQSYVRVFFSVSLFLLWLLAPKTCILG